jgi:hypothetical protein
MMRTFTILLLGVTLAPGLCSSGGFQASLSTTSRHPVVLELFTSEGCSSCPPADALLARLEEQQPFPDAEIIALEEHVDYWDQQGWVDPFSSEQWTLRQQNYASALGDHGVYTPELVVNGRLGFVGSHEGNVRQAIAAATAQPFVSVQLEPAKSEKHDRVTYKVTVGAPQPPSADIPEVWIAITERGLHSAVTRGENAGEHLRHASVLRSLRKLGTLDLHGNPGFSSQVDAKIDSAWNRGNLRAVAFIQEKRSRHILGAAALSIEP